MKIDTKKLLQRLLFGACAGISIGVIIQTVISSLSNTTYVPGVPSFLAKFQNIHTGVAIELILYALVGMFWCLDFLYRRVEQGKMRLFTATLIHFLGGIVMLSIVGYILEWYKGILNLFLFILQATIIYFIIWTIIYLDKKRQIKIINDRLKQSNPL